MVYHVHNTSRAQATRLQRYAAPAHRGMVQFLNGQRIVRGRPLALSEEGFLRNIEAIKKGVEEGWLEVRTPGGRVVDVATGEAVKAAPTPPLPVVVLDSVKNDPPSGIPMPIYPDGAVQSTTAPLPETMPAPPGMDEEEVEVEHTDSGSGYKKSKKGRR
jgi:hypothetical protein